LTSIIPVQPETTESGTLVDLITVQTSLAWDILHVFVRSFSTSKPATLTSASPIRLDSFETLVRGVTARLLRNNSSFPEAGALNPTYWKAVLRLEKPITETGKRSGSFLVGSNSFE